MASPLFWLKKYNLSFISNTEQTGYVKKTSIRVEVYTLS